jgi:Transcriptional regulators
METYTLENTTAREYAYQALKQRILTLDLQPGMKLSEQKISEELGVSRTPVREAFMKLRDEELLDIFPQSGTFVSKIDLTHAAEARFVRELVESAIISQACDCLNEDSIFNLKSNIMMQKLCMDSEEPNHKRFFDLDEAFHQEIFTMCNRAHTWHMIDQITFHLKRFRLARIALTDSLDWKIIIEQHQSILDSLLSRSLDNTKHCIEEHLRLMLVEKDILKLRYPDFFKPE